MTGRSAESGGPREASGRRGARGRLLPLRRRLEVLGIAFLYRVVPLLPRETLVALARGLGRLGFELARRERRVALANLDVAFGTTKTDLEKRRIARRSFQSFVQVGLEVFWARRMTPAALARFVEMEPEDAALPTRLVETGGGNGVLAVASHLGSWEVMNIVASRSYRGHMTTLARRLRNPGVDALVNANRKSNGGEVVYHDDAARGILRALRRNRIIAIPLDQNTRPDRGGVYVDFFGKPVAASRSIAVFALRTGAPIVASACLPRPGGRYKIEWRTIIPVPDASELPSDAPGVDDRDRVEREVTQRCVAFIESIVRRHPEAWLWMYRRWKYRPTADARGYPFYSKHVPEDAASASPPAARPGGADLAAARAGATGPRAEERRA